MASVCKVVIIGHMGKDPEEVTTGGGMQITSFSVATSKNYKVGDEWKEKTSWHNIKAFGNQAEYTAKFKKGNMVYIEGELDYQSWEKDGKKFNKTEIIVQIARNLSPREEGQQSQPKPQSQPQNKSFSPPKQSGSDDMPF